MKRKLSKAEKTVKVEKFLRKLDKLDLNDISEHLIITFIEETFKRAAIEWKDKGLRVDALLETLQAIYSNEIREQKKLQVAEEVAKNVQYLKDKKIKQQEEFNRVLEYNKAKMNAGIRTDIKDIIIGSIEEMKANDAKTSAE